MNGSPIDGGIQPLGSHPQCLDVKPIKLGEKITCQGLSENRSGVQALGTEMPRDIVSALSLAGHLPGLRGGSIVVNGGQGAESSSVPPGRPG